MHLFHWIMGVVFIISGLVLVYVASRSGRDSTQWLVVGTLGAATWMLGCLLLVMQALVL